MLSSGEVDIKKYREIGWIPTNMSFPKGTFENINNGRTIYNILTNLFDINLDGDEHSPGGFYDNLCIEYLSDEELECIGGRDILISMLETYGHLNGWYRASYDSENYGLYARFYRDEKEVVGYFDCCEDRTIQDICKYDDNINPIEVQKYLQNEFNEKYELTDRLGHDEIFSLALEFKIFYKL